MKKLSLLILSMISAFFLFSQTPGTLYHLFGNNGIVLTDYEYIGDDNYSYASAIQADLKIILGGHCINGGVNNIMIVRYHAFGNIDLSFGNDGIKVLLLGGSDDMLTDIAVQPDGKIVFVGYTNNGTKEQMIAGRLNTDGSLDNSFSATGMVVIDFGSSKNSCGMSMALLDDGKILIAGYTYETTPNYVSHIAMCRLTSYGVPDDTFGVNGLITYDFNDLWCYPDNVVIHDERIILGGVFLNSDFTRYVTLSRYYLDGTLDNNFGNLGYTTVELDQAVIGGPERGGMCMTADGKIVYANKVNPAWLVKDFAVLRFNQNGSVDNSFGTNGMIVTELEGNSSAAAVVAQADGKIIACGTHRTPDPGSDDFVLIRYLENGDLDASFGAEGTGVVISNISPEIYLPDKSYDMLFWNGDKLLVSGHANTDLSDTDFAMACYHTGLNVGIETPDNAEIYLSIYPNPVTDQATIAFKLTQAEIVKVEVMNTSGIIVANITYDYYTKGEHQLRWDGSRLAAGVYIVKMAVGDRVYTGKLVKTR